MSRNQVIILVFCVVLCLGIYVFAPMKKPGAATTEQTTAGETAPPAQELNIEEYIAEISAMVEDKPTRERIEQLTADKAYEQLVNEYIKLDKPLAVAHYAIKNAEAKSSEQEFVRAGNYCAQLMQTAPDEKARNFLSSRRVYCFEKAVALQPSDDNRLSLAQAYVEGGSNPMQGVTILREMVAKDSANIPAQLLLARFGMVSGQYDKAIVRLEKILSLAPQNQDALLLLAQAYEDSGNVPKAIETLERFKKTVTDAETVKRVEDYIGTLKKKVNS